MTPPFPMPKRSLAFHDKGAFTYLPDNTPTAVNTALLTDYAGFITFRITNRVPIMRATAMGREINQLGMKPATR